MERKMNRHERRKANKQKRKFHTMKDGTKVLVTKEIDLCDPNLDPKHRDTFIYAVRTEVVRLDEVLSRWYRRPVVQCAGLRLRRGGAVRAGLDVVLASGLHQGNLW
jgi:hypothetical protein